MQHVGNPGLGISHMNPALQDPHGGRGPLSGASQEPRGTGRPLQPGHRVLLHKLLTKANSNSPNSNSPDSESRPRNALVTPNSNSFQVFHLLDWLLLFCDVICLNNGIHLSSIYIPQLGVF